jgi:hypothetical protein
VIIEAGDSPPDDSASTAKIHHIRRWNDRAYKKFVAACADEMGLSIHMLYKRAGVDPSSHSKSAGKFGRSIEQILAIADAAGKDPALFIAAGILGRDDKRDSDLELAKLAVVSTLASHLYVALSPSQLVSSDSSAKLLNAVLTAIKSRD